MFIFSYYSIRYVINKTNADLEIAFPEIDNS